MGASSERDHVPRRVGGDTIQELGTRASECVLHGAFVSHGRLLFGRRECWTQCPDCARQAEIEAQAAEEQARAAAQQARLERATRQAAVPERFRGLSFENYVPECKGQHEALQVARDYAASFAQNRRLGRSLILVGGTGTGKTHLACAVLQSVLAQGKTGMYTTAMRLVRMVRDTWRRDAEQTEIALFEALSRVDLLVLDEIGLQYGTGNEQLILGEVLEHRYEMCAPSILLGNENMRGLRACIGERAFDRVREVARVVPFDWASHRKSAAGWQ